MSDDYDGNPTTPIDRLVGALRDECHWPCNEAADVIEKLAAENKRLSDLVEGMAPAVGREII